MRKALLLLVAAASFASPAVGAGLNLGWNDCPSGATYTLNRNFACNTNVAVHTLVGSFVAPAGVQTMRVNQIMLDLQTPGAVLSPWWYVWQGTTGACGTGCRRNSLFTNYDFREGPFTCFDYWRGGATGAFMQECPVGNRVRIQVIGAFPTDSPLITSVPEGLEVYSFKALISSQKTTGLGSCEGCMDQATIVLTSIRILQADGSPGTDIYVTQPATSNTVTWQGGATPAHNPTWGGIKALFR